MCFKLVLFLFALMPFVYQGITLSIIDRKRKEPLPAEVADVYTPERWQTFIDEKHEMRKPVLAGTALSLLLSVFLIFSPFFKMMEAVSSNVYVLTIVTSIVLSITETVISLPVRYVQEMVILTKYGLNKKDNKEFFKDEAISFLFGMAANTLMYLFAVYVLDNIESWTNGFSLPLYECFAIMTGIAVSAYAMILAISWISWLVMRKQYTFTELEEGELRDQIIALTEGAKKKIRKIEVYNESKKSTTKNAFMLKILNYRQFGIADNFLNENSERQLLGVLAHEAGHLKHKKNILDYVYYASGVVLIIASGLMIPHGSEIASVVTGIMNSAFGLSRIHYVLVFEMIGWFGQPLFALFALFLNYKSRWEEYEADRNSVKEGYGDDLIQLFKELSKDELVDVNPADIIEFLEYDHPGMYHRILAIQKASEQFKA